MRFEIGSLRVDIVRPPAAPYDISDTWASTWSEVPEDLPLQQRHDWPIGDSRSTTLLLRIESVELKDVVFVGVRCHRLRSLPGALYLHVPKFGVGMPDWALHATLDVVKYLSSLWFRVARIRIELCLLDRPDHLPEIEREALSLGFSVEQPLEYEHTLLVPIPCSSVDAEGQIHRNVFKNARKVARAGHEVRSFSNIAFAGRMAKLFEETMNRTGADIQVPDMESVLRVTSEQPDRYHVVGLFRCGRNNTDDLLAFRWCGHAGRYAYDLLAASTRFIEEDSQVPMMPAIMLKVFDWACSTGASTFDFGGVVLEGDAREKQVAGITRFKKQFGGKVVRVGADLLLKPNPFWQSVERLQHAIGI